MAMSRVRPSGGPSSSGPVGTARLPNSGRLEIGRAGGAVMPLGAGASIPPPGLVVAAGTRGNAGPGRPPSKGSPAPGTFSKGKPPAPGVRPSDVNPGSPSPGG